MISVKKAFSICQLYFYLICFTTLVIMITGGIRLVASLADLLFPSPLPYPVVTDMAIRYKEVQPYTGLSWEEFKQEMEKERARQEAGERVRVIRNLVTSVAFVLIPLPVYLIHWRRVREEKNDTGGD